MQKRPDECKTDLDGQVMHLQRLKSKVVQYIASTKQLLLGFIISIIQVVQVPFA